MRRSISMEGFYTLMTYSKRSAVFALRSRNEGTLVSGTRALAMVEAERTDPRDILWTIALLHHSAGRVGLDAGQLFHDVAALAESRVGELLDGFLSRSPGEQDLKAAWGHHEVEASAGPGLMGWGFRAYDPTCDLETVTIGIAKLMAADRYQPHNAQIATELPPVWLGANGDSTLRSTLRAVRACTSVSGQRRPSEEEKREDHLLLVFVAEATDASEARGLMGFGQRRMASKEAKIAVVDDRLFCLVVATPATVGVPPLETPESLARFSSPISRLLARAVQEYT